MSLTVMGDSLYIHWETIRTNHLVLIQRNICIQFAPETLTDEHTEYHPDLPLIHTSLAALLLEISLGCVQYDRETKYQ